MRLHTLTWYKNMNNKQSYSHNTYRGILPLQTGCMCFAIIMHTSCCATSQLFHKQAHFLFHTSWHGFVTYPALPEHGVYTASRHLRPLKYYVMIKMVF